MTLDDLEGPYAPCFKNAFLQPTTFTDIRGGSLDSGRQTTVGLSKTVISVLSLVISSEALQVRSTLLCTVNRGNTVLPDNFER